MSDQARDRFLKYDWPGNVREMENLVERAVLLCSGSLLDVGDFWIDDQVVPGSHGIPSAVPSGVGPMMGGPEQIPTLKEVERQMILQALQQTDNNRTHAAKLLGVSVRTLRNKLHEYRTQGIID